MTRGNIYKSTLEIKKYYTIVVLLLILIISLLLNHLSAHVIYIHNHNKNLSLPMGLLVSSYYLARNIIFMLYELFKNRKKDKNLSHSFLVQIYEVSIKLILKPDKKLKNKNYSLISA